MSRLPLIGGSYAARSIIANAQRCVNLFPEINPKDAPVPVTHYQRPGLTALVSGPVAPVRGIYRSSVGTGYCVIGQQVFYISPTFQLTQIGQITAGMGPLRNTPVSMIDNGTSILLVDGSTLGYQIALATNAFAQVVDGTGTFQGADRVDIMDTFVLWNMPGSTNFGSTTSGQLAFNALFFAGKVNYPDLLQTLIVNRHELLLIGQLKTEMWYDAGNAQFPFAEIPGAYFEHGTVAKYSVASQDISTFMLGQDLQGDGIVFRIRGYECKRVSNHALEFAIRQMKVTAGTIADAIGYCYQQDGHVFYVLCFPAGNQTWAFDDATEQWAQRAWTDANGNLQRDRTNCHANLYGKNVVGDWQNGTLYALDLNAYTDTVNGAAGPISFIRSFPHLGTGINAQGQEVPTEGKRIKVQNFIADIECGTGPVDATGKPPAVGMRWSVDRGRTFGETVLQSAGPPGHYRTQPKWQALGSEMRDPVFELAYSIAGPAALNGAWLDATVLGN